MRIRDKDKIDNFSVLYFFKLKLYFFSFNKKSYEKHFVFFFLLIKKTIDKNIFNTFKRLNAIYLFYIN